MNKIFIKLKIYLDGISINKRLKKWDFENIEEFLNYTNRYNENTLIDQYKKLHIKNGVEEKKLERKIKDCNSEKALNVKHLKIMMDVITKLQLKDEDIKNNLYNCFIKYLENKYSEVGYLEIFYELYSINLESNDKIKEMLRRYQLSLGIVK